MLFRVVAELWTRLLNYLTGMLRWGHPLRQESGYDAGYGAPGCGWRWGGMFQPNFNPFNMWFRQWYSSMPPFYYPQRVPCQNPNTGSYLNSLLSSSLKSTQVEIESDLKSQRAIARLKEPKDILPIPQQYPFQESTPPRWPTECQVVNIRIQHIDAVPNFQEAYYEMTGREVQPKPVGEQDGQVVFQYNPTSAVNYFSRSAVGGCRVLFSNERRQNGLKFESRFESGNLAKAVKITDTYYELSLRSDLYTNKHVQWFYFMVENMAKGVVYSEWFINPLIAEDDIMYTIQPAGDDRTMFSIVNLTKDDSLYNSGMKPVMYSTKDAFMRKLGWRRCGHNIAYYRNDSNGDDDQNATYTLTFNVEFPHDYDCVYLAHSYPYTYTDLQDYLIRLQNHPVKSMYTKLRLLCKSLAGNNVYYLTVTEPPPLDQNALPKKKKAVVISARVHPGETPASWMMKGVMDFITGDSKQAKELREKFIFKLIPMLNPDGVIVGNSRCSLTGRDLNRQYRTVIRETYPPVWHTKLMVKRLMEELGGVAMYCDFHAHSVKHNVFIYGCENRRQAPGGPDRRLHEQVFPLMLHKNTADKFSFENCKFRIQRSKEGTGRVVMWMMGVSNSYTMEASFAGSTLGTRYYTHFTTLDYEQMGKSFCETLLDFVDDAPSKERLRLKIVGRLQKEGSSADEPANIDLSDYTSDEGETSELSEDCPRVDKDSITAPPPSPATSEDKPIKIKRCVDHEHYTIGSCSQQETTEIRCIKIKLESLLPWDEATLRNREGSPKPFRAVITYSPAVQRKTMHIPRTLLDLETTTSGGEGTGDEGPRHQKKPSSSHHLLQLSSPTLARTTRQVQLPPELIVIPAQQGSDGQQYFERNADLKGSTRGPASKDASPNKEFRRDYSRSPARTLGEVSDSESGRLRSSKISLKQSIWTIVPPPDHRAKAPLSRSASMSDSCELVLLKSCSEKLLELKKVDKEAFAGRRRWHRAEGTQCPPPVQRNKKVKRKAPKLKKREVQEERPNLSLKIRGLRPDDSEQQYETNWLSTGKRSTSGATRKFRKGGIVATAVQMRPLSGYTSGADESAIVSGAAATATVGKKKRKKRKLQAIQKQVKSVISFVTASASHRPNKSDQQETAKKKNK